MLFYRLTYVTLYAYVVSYTVSFQRIWLGFKFPLSSVWITLPKKSHALSYNDLIILFASSLHLKKQITSHKSNLDLLKIDLAYLQSHTWRQTRSTSAYDVFLQTTKFFCSLAIKRLSGDNSFSANHV